MDILDRIRAIEGVADAGSCPYGLLDSYMSEPQRIGARRIIAAPRTVLCALFPYYSVPTAGNVSLYARGRDYPAVIHEALDPLCEALRAEHPGSSFEILTDDSPLPEVLTGCLAGLGVIGKNGLLLHPARGSFNFLGTILTDVDFHAPLREPVFCSNCGACARACPVGMDKSRCLSGLTQKGGELNEEEAANAPASAGLGLRPLSARLPRQQESSDRLCRFYRKYDRYPAARRPRGIDPPAVQ